MTSNYEPLFLKYRPQKLDDVLGQDSVRETLINAINNNKIVHAYLLTGPRGSGKTSSARILAKSLNCLSPDDSKSPTTQPCGTCESCVGIANSSSVDVTEIDAASHGHVEDARRLIEKVNLASVTGKYRVYIIDEVHMLTTSAFNALLKVIEEPPANVIFILATTELDKVPKTIASRCQQLKFRPISIQDSIKRMSHVATEENINISDAAIKLIAEHSDGAMRDALSLLDQLSVFSGAGSEIDENKVLEILGAIPSNQLTDLSLGILERDSEKLLKILDELLTQGKDAISISQELSNFLIALLESINSKTDDFADLRKSLEAAKIENYELVQIIDSLSDLEIRLKQSTQNKNLLKAWLVKICHRADILVVKDLLERVEKLEAGITSAPAKPSSMPARPESQQKPIPVKKPVPVVNSNPEPEAQPAAEEPSSSSSGGFIDFLSPGSKGMYVSSQARLISIENSVAKMQMPTKFKFLKSKLEDRSQEIITAIEKASGGSVNTLDIEVVDTLDEPSPELASITASSGGSNDSSKKKARGRNPLDGLVPDSVDTPPQQAIIQPSANLTKLDEVAQAAISVFNAKELKM